MSDCMLNRAKETRQIRCFGNPSTSQSVSDEGLETQKSNGNGKDDDDISLNCAFGNKSTFKLGL